MAAKNAQKDSANIILFINKKIYKFKKNITIAKPKE